MIILHSAMKYTPQDTPIELLAAVKESNIIVKISDREPGVPSVEKKRILEEFVRGAVKGVGIGRGLAVCDAIIALHRGRMWIKNKPEGGSVFFALPIGKQPPRIEIEENV